MNHKAVFALYPQVASFSDVYGALNKDGNQVQIDMAAVNAWIDPEAYKYKREKEYPPITDYLDGIVKGNQAQIDAYIAACQAVKTKYPKPE